MHDKITASVCSKYPALDIFMFLKINEDIKISEHQGTEDPSGTELY